jgi:hypothetical protein
MAVVRHSRTYRASVVGENDDVRGLVMLMDRSGAEEDGTRRLTGTHRAGE